MIRAAIIGATGYTGAELMRILLFHPAVELVAITSESSIEQRACQHYPALSGLTDLRFEANNPEKLAPQIDVAFLALPHAEAMEAAVDYLQRGVRVIDLSADFRLNSPQLYEQVYGRKHIAPQLLAKSAYGLTELNREAVTNTDLVANPGCYPTCVLLSLAPLFQQQLAADPIIIDAKSGVTGAGKKLNTRTQFAEANEGLSPYGVGGHRHQPEMVQELAKLGGYAPEVVFTPHLLPLSRGMQSTSYVPLTAGVSRQQVVEGYQQFCENEPFLHFLGEDIFPNVRDVRGSNNCLVGIHVDKECRRAIVIAVIDNLVKGASGAAVQNMNLMFNYPEEEGLRGIFQVL
ncbi:N-acetyl-gamma-glutamyl-phosphate reductase [Desulfurispira natronophila]|uniref:N-acetyl-gamma-glutamyl-phosphate reductase n=1 Tax=Desulfurispira natronophila TaxID=682562 RepID=A0A7W7Y3K9_9BACT|nr:N-acetyl-gamma-glutamyl-phosphate reductase [Desulfurispira natronophila]MBB5021455.1 N-acetyl-gamma-glutamyl-phosphate reductase [Desulfurispira natronophila]